MRHHSPDPLSRLLRRGDPASEEKETHSASERRANLLSRCASESGSEVAALNATSKHGSDEGLSRRPVWQRPAVSGLIGMAAVLVICAFLLSPRARIVQPSQRHISVARVATQPILPVDGPFSKPQKESKLPRSLTIIAQSAPTRQIAHTDFGRTLSKEQRSQNAELGSVPVQHLATAKPQITWDQPLHLPTVRRQTLPVSVASPANSALSVVAETKPKIAAPVVERVIIEQDDTVARPEVPRSTAPASVAILLSQESQAVVVSHELTPDSTR